MKVLSSGLSTQYFVKQLIAIILVTTLILMLSISYAYPSLVDHRPGQTLVGKYNIMNRQAINFIDKETI